MGPHRLAEPRHRRRAARLHWPRLDLREDLETFAGEARCGYVEIAGEASELASGLAFRSVLRAARAFASWRFAQRILAEHSVRVHDVAAGQAGVPYRR
jgi:hypothetical protein